MEKSLYQLHKQLKNDDKFRSAATFCWPEGEVGFQSGEGTMMG